jgi:hypothetical protein
VLIDNTSQISSGFAKWELSDEWLADGHSANISIFFVFPGTDGTLARTVGPRLQVFPSNGSGSGINQRALRIALPVVLSIVFAALLGAGLWVLWRKRRGGGEGYGVRKSRIQRVSGTATKGGIRMNDYGSPSPNGGGRNLFRDEVRRQEQQGRQQPSRPQARPQPRPQARR